MNVARIGHSISTFWFKTSFAFNYGYSKRPNSISTSVAQPIFSLTIPKSQRSWQATGGARGGGVKGGGGGVKGGGLNGKERQNEG
jgi:hypothetical protein